MAVEIHPTTHIHPTAEIGTNVEIGPYCTIGPNVDIGDDCVLHSHISIIKNVRLDRGVIIHFNACLGGDPQDYKYSGEPSYVTIGNGSIIREFVTVHRAATPEASTTIGENCQLLVSSHVGHDCQVGDNVVLTNYVGLGGYSLIGDNVVMGAYAGTHQHCRIGNFAMIGAKSKITQDIPPFCMTADVPLRLCCINRVGMQRANIDSKDIQLMHQCFKYLFRNNLSISSFLEKLSPEQQENQYVKILVKFLEAPSTRGVFRKANRN